MVAYHHHWWYNGGMTQPPYDVALSATGAKREDGTYTHLGIAIPISISRAFNERGFNRVTIEVTKEGLLLKPYVSEKTGHAKRPKHIEELPF